MIIDTLTAILVLLGCALGIVGGLGMHRFKDFYARLHAVGVTDTLCSFLILLGLALQTGWSLVTVKLLFIFMFLFFTSPTSSFSLANNAWQWGLRPQSTPAEAVTKKEELNQ
jgi:multicomponent Na+:H+ antiporter subunit G